jgi:hypothetical protein
MGEPGGGVKQGGAGEPHTPNSMAGNARKANPARSKESNKVTEAQRRRALRHADIPWDEKVADPRKARGRVHPHRGILGLLMAAFACGLATLRRAEDLGEDLGRGARRALGLPRKVSDSTLYRMAAKQNPEGFRETLWAQVRELFKRKVVQNDLFPVGVMSFDGKGNWSSTSHDVDGARQSSCGAGESLWLLGSLRAVLTSSQVRPCVDMEFIGDKEGESPAFRTVLPRVCAQCRRQVRGGDGECRVDLPGECGAGACARLLPRRLVWCQGNSLTI